MGGVELSGEEAFGGEKEIEIGEGEGGWGGGIGVIPIDKAEGIIDEILLDEGIWGIEEDGLEKHFVGDEGETMVAEEAGVGVDELEDGGGGVWGEGPPLPTGERVEV